MSARRVGNAREHGERSRVREDVRGIDEELRFHLEGRIEALVAEGVPEEEARRRALDAFGDLERVRAEMRRIEQVRAGRANRRWRVESVWTDVRLGTRRLLRSPVATAAAALTLGLAIGAAVAVFSVLDAVVLRPLPYPAPGELVQLSPGRPMNVALSRELSDAIPSVTSYTGISRWQLTLTGEGEARTLAAEVVDAGYFDVLGVRPVLGRALTREDTDPAAAGVVLLSHDLWRSVFGGDASVLGRRLELEGYGDDRLEVVGVMPRGFRSIGAAADGRPLDDADVWVPLQLAPARTPATDSAWFVTQLIARVRQDVGIAQVAQETRNAAAKLHETWPFLISEEHLRSAGAMRLLDGMVAGVRGTLWMLLGAVGLVVLIACANLANLQLARGAVRRRDFALRAALGASRGRLVREQLAESAVLAAAGGAIGILIAGALLDVLRVAQSYGLPRVHAVELDARAVVFAVAVTALCVLIFGVVPALRTAAVPPRDELQRAGRGSASGASHRLSRALVTAEVALSVVLVSAAALVLASFLTVRSVDAGIDVDDVTIVRLWPPARSYEDEAAVQLYRRLEERIAAMPGVRAVGAIQLEPFTGGNWAFPYLADGQTAVAGTPLPSANFRVVTPGYFDAVDMPLLAGRRFTGADSDGAARVMILNETFARTLWPGADPIGREVRVFGDLAFSVVGVVGDVRQHGLDRASSAEMYVPHAQWDLASMAVMVEAEDGPSLTPAIEAAVAEIDADIPVAGARPLEDLLGESLARRRFFASLLGGFGALALLLGSVGIYGVTSQLVGSMMPDAGVRLALGATPGDVLRHVMRRSLVPAAAGLVLGLGGALASSGLLRGLLFGVAPVNLPTYAGVGLGLSAIAILATWLPARRVARLDPLTVLRSE